MYRITIILPMIGLKSWLGCHFWSLSYGIGISRSVAPTMWGNGLSKLKHSEAGMTGVGKVEAKTQFCSAMEILESARHSSGIKNYFLFPGEGGKRASANKPRR